MATTQWHRAKNFLQYLFKVFMVFLFLIINCNLNAHSNENPQNLYSEGHDSFVLAVTFTPDSKYVVSGGGDNTVRIWNIKTGKHLKCLGGEFFGRTESVAVSSDGRFVASAAYFDKKIRIWQTKNDDQYKTLSGHSFFGAWSVAFSPDTKRIVSGGADGTIRLWSLESGKQIYVNRSHKRGFLSDILSVSFSPDGKFIASGNFDKTICILNSDTGKEFRVLKGHDAEVCSVDFDPSGKKIASGSSDNTVRLWDIETGKLINIFKGHKGFVNSVDFSPDGKFILSGGDDKTIRLWDVQLKKEEKVYRGHSGIVWSVAFSPDGKQFISGGSDRKIILWDKKSGKTIRIFKKRVHVKQFLILPIIVFFLCVFLIFLITGNRLKKNVKETQLQAFSQNVQFVKEFRQALNAERTNPRQTLSTYKKLQRKNKEWHWDIVLLVTAMPVIAFILSFILINHFGVNTWIATIFILFPFGFYPRYIAVRNITYNLSGSKVSLQQANIWHFFSLQEDKHWHFFVLPIIEFFWTGIQLFMISILTYLLLLLTIHLSTLTMYLLTPTYLLFLDGLTYSEAVDKISDYLGLPILITYFSIITIVWHTKPVRIFSLSRLLVAIRLGYKGVLIFTLNILILLFLSVSISGFFHQHPLYGGLLSLAIGVFFSLNDGKQERFFAAQYLIYLAEIRCLVRLKKMVKAEREMQSLLLSSIHFSSLHVVRNLTYSLQYLLNNDPNLDDAIKYVDEVKIAAEKKYGDIGLATVLNTYSALRY